MGGGVTAAVLLGAGLVESSDAVTVIEPPIARRAPRHDRAAARAA